jgi:dihydrolipoamide dehydrogenase
MPDPTYDLIVIGAGPGGYVAAIRAAQLGMRVACVEKDATLGGTCLNVGCIPSKALLDSSEKFYETKKKLGDHGIRIAQVDLDLERMLARKDKVVTANTKGVASLFRKNKVDWLKGRAKFVDAKTLRIDGAESSQVKAERILVATGSAPVELRDLPFDGKRVISSTEALTLPAVPEKMLVVGAGAVGLELGSVWSRLGAEVLVVEMLDHIVPGMDREATTALQRALEKQGLAFRLGTKVASAKVSANGVRAQLGAGGKQEDWEGDVVLVAVGRRAFSDALGLQAVGVQLDERGRVDVNDRFETNVPGVFAIGDVVRGAMLAHKASEEGIAAVEGMAGMPVHVNYEAIPNVVYTHPELASVGISEEEAKQRGVEYRKGSFPFLANGRARAMNDTDGFVKILADAKTDRILGIHIIGPHASDLIAEAAIAMEFHASAEDLARSSHAHPTLAEAIKEAALGVDGRTIHI